MQNIKGFFVRLFKSKNKGYQIIRATIIILIMFSFFYRAYFFIASHFNGMSLYEMKLFNEYRVDFEHLVDVLYPYYEDAYEKDNSLKFIHFNTYNENVTVDLYYQDQSKDTHTTLQLDEKAKISFERVKEAFRKSNSDYGELLFVSVTNGQISFRRNVYALVWQKSITAPEYIATPNNEKELFVKRISHHWFHCIWLD